MLLSHPRVKLGLNVDATNGTRLASIYRSLKTKGYTVITGMLGGELTKPQKSQATLEEIFNSRVDKARDLMASRDMSAAKSLLSISVEALSALLAYGNSCPRQERPEVDKLAGLFIGYLAEANMMSMPIVPFNQMAGLLAAAAEELQDWTVERTLDLFKKGRFPEESTIHILTWWALSPEESQGRSLAMEECLDYTVRALEALTLSGLKSAEWSVRLQRVSELLKKPLD